MESRIMRVLHGSFRKPKEELSCDLRKAFLC